MTLTIKEYLFRRVHVIYQRSIMTFLTLPSAVRMMLMPRRRELVLRPSTSKVAGVAASSAVVNAGVFFVDNQVAVAKQELMITAPCGLVGETDNVVASLTDSELQCLRCSTAQVG